MENNVRQFGTAMIHYRGGQYSECLRTLTDLDFPAGDYNRFGVGMYRYLAARKGEPGAVGSDSPEALLQEYVKAALGSESADLLVTDIAEHIFMEFQDSETTLSVLDTVGHGNSPTSQTRIDGLRTLCQSLTFDTALVVLEDYPTITALFDWLVKYCAAQAADDEQRRRLLESLEQCRERFGPDYDEAITEYVMQVSNAA